MNKKKIKLPVTNLFGICSEPGDGDSGRLFVSTMYMTMPCSSIEFQEYFYTHNNNKEA